MDVVMLKQEKTKDNKKIFGTLGVLLSDIKVHKALGAAITSREGDIWFICTCGGHSGFALLRTLKSRKAAHIRYIYAEDDKPMASALLSAVMGHLKATGCVSAHTNDRRSSQLWADHGFNLRETARRGAFVRWEKEIHHD